MTAPNATFPIHGSAALFERSRTRLNRAVDREARSRIMTLPGHFANSRFENRRAGPWRGRRLPVHNLRQEFSLPVPRVERVDNIQSPGRKGDNTPAHDGNEAPAKNRGGDNPPAPRATA